MAMLIAWRIMNKTANRQETREAYAAALGVYDENETPTQWAIVRDGLGNLYWERYSRAWSDDDFQEARKARAAVQADCPLR